MSNIPVLLIWVDSEKGQCYWKRITKKTKINELYISKNAIISPSTAVDLSLYLDRNLETTKLIKIKQLMPPLSLSLRKFAKQYFKENLLRLEIVNPYLGKVSVSWALWRHLTRKERPQKFIASSLSLLSNIEEVLANPSEFVGLRRLWRRQRGRLVTEGRLLAFDSYGVCQKHGVRRNIRSVIKERLWYPADWMHTSTSNSLIRREHCIESIYEKKVR